MIKTILCGQALNGQAIQEFEGLISTTLGAKYVISFPSGRSGFFFLLDALFHPGDEIILPVFTFPLFVRLLHEKGIKPVFVDIERKNALINPDLIEDKISTKTKAILITHLFGNSCEMGEIVKLCGQYGLYLLEDCAHAFGSQYNGQPVGTFGCASIFSTSCMKVPTTLGGGFIITNNEVVFKKIRSALFVSKHYRYRYDKFLKMLALSLLYYAHSFPSIFSILASRVFKYLGVKNPGIMRKLFYSELISQKPFDPFERTRLTNLQAVVGISQIQRNQGMIERRRRYAEIFDSYFAGNDNIIPMAERNGNLNNYLYYVVRLTGDVESFIQKATSRGLFLMRENVWHCGGYAFSKPYFNSHEYPIANDIQPQLVRLPNSSLLSEKRINEIAEIVRNVGDSIR